MALDQHDGDPDPYETLGVSPSASPSEIRRAYRRLVLSHHPDRMPPHERARAEERTKRINAAAAVLLDPARRASLESHRARRPGAARAATADAARGWPFVGAAAADENPEVAAAKHARSDAGFAHRLRRIDAGAVVSVVAALAFVLLARHLTSPSAQVIRRDVEPVPASAPETGATPTTARPSVHRSSARSFAWRTARWSGERRVGWRQARESAGRRARARRSDAERTTRLAGAMSAGDIRWPVIEQAMRELEANQNGAHEDDASRSDPTAPEPR